MANLDSRLRKAEEATNAQTRRALAAELGGLVLTTMNGDGLYHAPNGRTFTQAELDKLKAECEPSETPLLIMDMGAVSWTPN